MPPKKQPINPEETPKKQPIHPEDVIDAIQHKSIVDIMMDNVTQYFTPLVELIVNKMTASLSEALEKMVDQKVADSSEATIKICDEKISVVRQDIMNANEEKTTRLEKTLAILERRLDGHDIQGRSKTLIVYGLDEDTWVKRAFRDTTTEAAPTSTQLRMNLIRSVIDLCSARLQINLPESDISDVRRFAEKKGNSPRPVLIEFTTKIIRDRIYSTCTSHGRCSKPRMKAQNPKYLLT